jgi:predicted HAD superfamily Cof-like phosphohydrolase
VMDADEGAEFVNAVQKSSDKEITPAAVMHHKLVDSAAGII